ncbi:hypothetical protein OE88DRAFT_1722408 [Heliocybe sulcata]|uniref:F-box domain-containing protein n=1 Tax=Heliocybe sulcata TaxID=5364 RepID=A0A5C3NJK2_9AGAM|nr:hypothetical protein OE88DRAFT_1722408 [Heliocybe sulcata]
MSDSRSSSSTTGSVPVFLPAELRNKICFALTGKIDQTNSGTDLPRDDYYYGAHGLERRTLLALALTCSTWRDPALDALWWDMDSIYPLLKLLEPAIVVQPYLMGRDPDDPLLNVNGLIELADLARFEAYSARVRVIRIELWHLSYAATGALLDAISRPLLPKVERVTWSSRAAEVAPLSYFVHEELRGLDLRVSPNRGSQHEDAEYDGMDSGLADLPDRCPGLRWFAASRALSSVLVKLSSRLQFLAFMPRLQDFSQVLPGLTNLTHLELSDFPVPTRVFDESAVTARATLPQLRSLLVCCLTLEAAAAMLRALTSPHLSSCHFYHRPHSPGFKWSRKGIHALCVALSRFNESLTEVIIKHYGVRGERLPFWTIEPLLELRHLRKLHLVAPYDIFILNDNAMSRLLSSFPEMRELSLSSSGYSVQSILSMFTLCPWLEIADFGKVDASAFAEVHERQGDAPPRLAHLTLLVVRFNNVADIDGLSHFLERMVPHLHEACFPDGDEDEKTFKLIYH